MLWNYCQIWTVYFAIQILNNQTLVWFIYLIPVRCTGFYYRSSVNIPYSRILHALATRLYAQTFQLNRNYQTVVNHIYKYVPLFIRFNLPQISTALFLTIISTQSQPNTFQKCRFPNWICADLSSSSIPTKNDHFADNA